MIRLFVFQMIFVTSVAFTPKIKGPSCSSCLVVQREVLLRRNSCADAFRCSQQHRYSRVKTASCAIENGANPNSNIFTRMMVLRAVKASAVGFVAGMVLEGSFAEGLEQEPGKFEEEGKAETVKKKLKTEAKKAEKPKRQEQEYVDPVVGFSLRYDPIRFAMSVVPRPPLARLLPAKIRLPLTLRMHLAAISTRTARC